MRRRVLVFGLIILTVLAPALASAADNCAGMSIECGGACGTAQAAVAAILAVEVRDNVAPVVPYLVPQKPHTTLRPLDRPPPRSRTA